MKKNSTNNFISCYRCGKKVTSNTQHNFKIISGMKGGVGRIAKNETK